MSCPVTLHLTILLSIEQHAQDIDIIVSEDDYLDKFDPEDIKEAIVVEDARYYLVQSRRREATHRILYCRLPGWARDKTRRVKVDILVPPTGDHNLPVISEDERFFIDSIPVMPIFDLLVMKTQGWWHHCTSSREDFSEKESADVSDIFALLDRAKQENVSFVDEANEERHSPEFMSYASTLAKRFVRDYGRPRRWRTLGFPV